MNPFQEKFPISFEHEPPELLISDGASPCPYIAGKDARMPLRVPVRSLTRAQWDARLAEGDRRHGAVLYRTQCPECSACEPIRVNIKRFRFSRNHRRVLKKASVLTIKVQPPQLTPTRLQLYEKHITERHLRSAEHNAMTPIRYQNFLVETCCDTFELTGTSEGKLLFVATTDRAQRSLSAHYTFYDPSFSSLSLGTFAILKQIEICQRWGLDYLYLGLYVAENGSMRYKGRFRPHQRLIDGKWQSFERQER